MQQKKMTVGVSLAEEITEVIRQRLINSRYAMGEKLVGEQDSDGAEGQQDPRQGRFQTACKGAAGGIHT